jgi:hypothetical protein
MIEKDRVRIEWIEPTGNPSLPMTKGGQIIPNVARIQVAEGMVFVYVMVDEEEQNVLGVPVARLIRYAKLKDREEVTDDETGEGGEPSEDTQVCDSADK